MWALLPLKLPEGGKPSLSSALGSAVHRDIFFSVAQHVIDTLHATRDISRVLVVTGDDVVDGFAQWCDAEVIRLLHDEGTNSALVSAIAKLQDKNMDRLLMIAGDLPLLTTAAVQKMVDAAKSGAEIVIAPDRRRRGTNALLCSPPTVISPQFGADSFSRHCEAAISVGISPRVIATPALAFDLDAVEDISYLSSRTTNGDIPTALATSLARMRKPCGSKCIL